MPKIRAIIFDCYSTLINIRTNEKKDEIYDYLSVYMNYYGAKIDAPGLKSAISSERENYLQLKKDEPYPEIDLEILFKNIIKKEGLNNPFLAESCCKLLRVISRDIFELFPDSLPVLEEIKRSGYPLAVVSDAQKVFCLEEGEMLGISQYFKFVLLSTYFGFRKPDPRLFTIASALLDTAPAEVVYIGNDPDTDVKGARQVGMRAILVDRNSTNRSTEPRPDFYARNLWEALDWIKAST